MTGTFNGNDIIKKTYELLCDRLNGRTIELPRNARAIVSDDSDGHRIREGHVTYKQAQIIEVNGLPWALMCGSGYGAYGRTAYDDLLATDLRSVDEDDTSILTAIVEQARQNSWYRDSLCWGDDDGGLKVGSNNNGRVSRPVLARRITDLARSHELSTPTISPGGMFFNLRSGAYSYDAKLAPKLSKLLEQYFRMPYEQ